MNARILNRDFTHPADGWYHVEPKGEHLNADAGIVQVIDDEASRAIVNRFNADADAGKLSHGTEMLVDHEHFKHDLEKETRAYGWLTRLQNRDDGIYGQIRWSTTGKAAVDGGDYRFFSTEYDQGDLKVLNKAGGKTRARPLRLDGLTLTNSPRNKGGRPITNRNNLEDSPPTVPATESTADIQNKQTSMKKLAHRLGLSDDASEEAILGELTKLENRATTAEGQLKPLTEENTLLKNRVTKIEDEKADADLDHAGIKADDADRASIKSLLLTNREGGLAMLKRITGAAKATAKPQLTNRDTAKTPGSDATPADETELARKADAKIQSYKLTNRCSYAQARNAVRAMEPELFGLATK